MRRNPNINGLPRGWAGIEMIEVGTTEEYVAVYRGEMTPEGYRCAVEIACAGLLGLYEPVWFAPEAIARFMAELEGLIDGRRSFARLATTPPATPRLALTVSWLLANYKLTIAIAVPRLSSTVDVGPAVLSVAVPHESLLMAFRELRNHMPDVPPEREKTSRTIDLSWDGDNGCRLTLRSFETRFPMANFDCEVAINSVSMTLHDVAFLGDTLQEFASGLLAMETGQSTRAEVYSAGMEFKLSVVAGRGASLWVEVALHVHEIEYRDTHEQTLTGRYPIGHRTLSLARRTLSELLRVFDEPEVR